MKKGRYCVCACVRACKSVYVYDGVSSGALVSPSFPYIVLI